jgi:hypothetical protein
MNTVSYSFEENEQYFVSNGAQLQAVVQGCLDPKKV